MKTIMITKGLKGRSNLEAYHKRCKDLVRDKFGEVQFTGDIVEFKHIENFDYSNTKHRVQALINTLQDQLMVADAVVFFDDWYNFAGCSVEHEICKQYGIPIVYMESGLY